MQKQLRAGISKGAGGGEKLQGKQDSIYLPSTSSLCARKDNSSRRKQILPWNLALFFSFLVAGREGEAACASEASLSALNLINRDCAM